MRLTSRRHLVEIHTFAVTTPTFVAATLPLLLSCVCEPDVIISGCAAAILATLANAEALNVNEGTLTTASHSSASPGSCRSDLQSNFAADGLGDVGSPTWHHPRSLDANDAILCDGIGCDQRAIMPFATSATLLQPPSQLLSTLIDATASCRSVSVLAVLAALPVAVVDTMLSYMSSYQLAALAAANTASLTTCSTPGTSHIRTGWPQTIADAAQDAAAASTALVRSLLRRCRLAAVQGNRNSSTGREAAIMQGLILVTRACVAALRANDKLRHGQVQAELAALLIELTNWHAAALMTSSCETPISSYLGKCLGHAQSLPPSSAESITGSLLEVLALPSDMRAVPLSYVAAQSSAASALAHASLSAASKAVHYQVLPDAPFPSASGCISVLPLESRLPRGTSVSRLVAPGILHFHPCTCSLAAATNAIEWRSKHRSQRSEWVDCLCRIANTGRIFRSIGAGGKHRASTREGPAQPSNAAYHPRAPRCPKCPHKRWRQEGCVRCGLGHGGVDAGVGSQLGASSYTHMPHRTSCTQTCTCTQTRCHAHKDMHMLNTHMHMHMHMHAQQEQQHTYMRHAHAHVHVTCTWTCPWTWTCT